MSAARGLDPSITVSVVPHSGALGAVVTHVLWHGGAARIAVLVAIVSAAPVVEITGGAFIVVLAVLLGRKVTCRIDNEGNPGRLLLWNFVLALVVLLALVGTGVMAAAIR